MTKFTIDKGDTLTKIAEKTGVSVEEIMAANPNIKNKDVIYAGDSIEVPEKGVKGWWDSYVGFFDRLFGNK